jgi:mRNA-degrading endonuclease toxin of MazEF toxin-antitoxin module
VTYPVPLKQWHVYHFNQEASRKASKPVQPLDELRLYRRFMVITPNKFLSAAVKITCVPIGERSFNRFLHVPLTKGEAGCTKDCHIWTNEIYTLDLDHFFEEYGRLPDGKIAAVELAIKDYLGH